MDRASVRAELERKKAQLALMRQERERRSQMPQQDRIDDVVLNALNLSSQAQSPSEPARLSVASSEPSSTPIPSLTPVASAASITSTAARIQVPLEIVHVNQISIPPKERVTYTKSTQTQTKESAPTPHTEEAPQKSYYGKQNTQAGVNQLALEWDDEFPVLTYQDDEDEQSSDFNNIASDKQNKTTQKGTNTESETAKSNERVKSQRGPPEITDLVEEEKKQIELREDYQQFVERAAKILERALYANESPEIFIQYFPEDGKSEVDNDRKSGNKLSLDRIFVDDKWSKNRCVTGFDWSSQYPELLLASYYTNEQAPSDPDGTLLVWNTKFKNATPEYIFHCQSPIMSCCFAKFHPSLIVGGTYSGQIVLWDMRSNKKTPVQRSPLTASVHTHPVYCVKVVGTQNSHNLISISTDGKLCSWSLDMLSSPQETMELNNQKLAKSVAVTCMSFHPDDYNNFLVGSEEGTVYSACRHGSKTGILSSFDGHQGLVTSVDFQPNLGQSDYTRQFLTSSIDWTVKLWDIKESEPTHSFESNGDYIYDVKWCPTNPELFATVDGDGRVDLWNLASDKELPTASTVVSPVSIGESRSIQPSLNKLIWSPNGNRIIVGDDVGRVHVYDVGIVDDVSRVTI